MDAEGKPERKLLMLRMLKSYLFWTYQRGSVQYDVMVTAILVFMFATPRVLDFKAQPVETVAIRSSEVLVREAGHSGDSARFIYQIRADHLSAMGTQTSDAAIRAALLRAIEPISGEVTLEGYQEVKDAAGHIIAYDASVLR